LPIGITEVDSQIASQPQHKLKPRSSQERRSHSELMKPTRERFCTTVEPWEQVNTL